MLLTAPQLSLFWREWAKTCHAMNWTREAGLTTAAIDAKRREIIAQCGFDSLTKVTVKEGFDRLLNELRCLQGVSLEAAMQATDPALQQAERIRHQILTEYVPCLELYIADVREYMTSIMEDKNRWWKIDRPIRDITLMDLTATPIQLRNGRVMPSQLEQLRFTLQRCLNLKRNAAGHTIHQMKIAAGVPCDCARICQSARNQVHLQAALATDDEAVAETELQPDSPF